MGKIYDALQKNKKGSQPPAASEKNRPRDTSAHGSAPAPRQDKTQKLRVVKTEGPLEPQHASEHVSPDADNPVLAKGGRSSAPAAQPLNRQDDGTREVDAPKSEIAGRQSVVKKEPVADSSAFARDFKALDKPIDPRLMVYHQPESFEAEQVKIIRTNILFPESGIPPRTIMVTSAAPGDGKSFIAASLSISIAQSLEEHVLLMDCDFRNSSIHGLFGYPQGQGLSDYLAKDLELSSVIGKTALEKLSIIQGGTISSNPSELLSSKKMFDLIAEAKKRYSDRYIIVDTPPPQITAEASAIARIVDGIIIVVSAGYTNRDKVTHLLDILGRKKILGVVINRYDIAGSRYDGYDRTKYHTK